MNKLKRSNSGSSKTKRSSMFVLAMTVAIVLVGCKQKNEPANATTTATASASAIANQQERKVLYWHDPMVPGQRFDKPGKSPFMDMDLVPVYADSNDGKVAAGGVSIDPGTLQNMGLRTAKAVLASFPIALDAVGVIKADERQIEVIQSRTSASLEVLHVRSVHEIVQIGQVVAEIVSPDLLAAQEEFLLAKKSPQDTEHGDKLLQAARTRLSILGFSSAQIEKLENTQQAQRRVSVLAPISGVVTELNVRQGAPIPAGTAIMTITDFSNVWAIAEVPEIQHNRIKIGSAAEIRLTAFPEKSFSGVVDYLYPTLSAGSRTLKVRVALANPTGELKPEMFASMSFNQADETKVLMVPSEAVISTGKRNVVIVAENGGRFSPVDVKVGREHDGQSEILSGLSEGKTVVTSGQFLIDSESSLKTTIQRFETVPVEKMN